MLSQITRPAAPCLARRFAGPLLSVLVAAVLSACANYAGIRSDKRIAEPTTYASTQSIPAEQGHWPSADEILSNLVYEG
ncbi:hypothetical protein [Cupriavidus sp. BIC8F]|uniref:hypothetical protein n=1 Tax=Cupriavidus sp. BIC8F TaxID=3079014 RepID=UPI0029166365|nr:hypothetical protein [Cupriavidus sp. BIC8F]